MIRSVVTVNLRPDHDQEAVATVCAGFAALNTPGTVSYTIGPDLGLREGNWSFAIVADFEDEDAYRRYDRDEEHNRLRGELLPFVADISRVQFAVDAPAA